MENQKAIKLWCISKISVGVEDKKGAVLNLARSADFMALDKKELRIKLLELVKEVLDVIDME